jgi:UDP-glucuronate 4-epimerase
MRIVVTGVAGFIGHHVARRLLDDGHHVVGVDCFLAASYEASVKRAAVAPLTRHSRFVLHRRDLRTQPLDDVLDGADAVVHLAAMTGLRSDLDDLYFSCNLAATARLAATAERAGTPRIVHASTSSVYGRVADGDENQPLAPISAYGRSKQAAELVMLDAGAVVLRYFSVYGPGQRPDMAYHRFCEAILDGRPVEIHGDGAQQRANTYIGDVVEATVAALGRGGAGEAYNIGGAEPVRLLDAVTVLGQAVGPRPVLAPRPARPGDQRRTRADTEKARRHLGWSPLTPAVTGLHAQAAWHVARRARFVAA